MVCGGTDSCSQVDVCVDDVIIDDGVGVLVL